jgi:hypothetical protein
MSWPSSSGLWGCRRTHLTILQLADHALFAYGTMCSRPWNNFVLLSLLLSWHVSILKCTLEQGAGAGAEGDMGPRYGTLIWDPDLVPWFGTPIWHPDFGPQFCTSILDPNLWPRFGGGGGGGDIGPWFGTPIWDLTFWHFKILTF